MLRAPFAFFLANGWDTSMPGCPTLATFLFLWLGWDSSPQDRKISRALQAVKKLFQRGKKRQRTTLVVPTEQQKDVGL